MRAYGYLLFGERALSLPPEWALMANLTFSTTFYVPFVLLSLHFVYRLLSLTRSVDFCIKKVDKIALQTGIFAAALLAVPSSVRVVHHGLSLRDMHALHLHVNQKINSNNGIFFIFLGSSRAQVIASSSRLSRTIRIRAHYSTRSRSFTWQVEFEIRASVSSARGENA